MKANRKFVNADEAVSPVIGVILMVAITVVLAAVVFVLVSDLGGESNSAPAISWSQKENTDRLEVTSASSSADWSRLSVRATSCSLNAATDEIHVGGSPTAAAPHHNEVAAAGGGNLESCDSTDVPIATAVDTIGAGDFLEFCASTDAGAGAAGGDATNVVIVITDTTANSKVGEWTFSTIAPC